jgi:ABC-type cobalamin/Fe3+-siderophores transport system ATPase subunit
MLSISHISFTLKKRTLIHDITEDFHEGYIYGLLGPNGSGKSTLLRNIAGIWIPDHGEVLWQGKKIQKMPREFISKTITLVPQTSMCHFSFSVEEIVGMGRYAHFDTRNAGLDTIISAMDSMDVSHLRNRPITEISCGERQRVFLARALATESSILLLDEPTSSLDIQHQLLIWNLLRKLKEEGKTIIVATHDIVMARRYCDKLLILQEGRCVSKGSVKDALSKKTLEEVFSVREEDLPVAAGFQIHQNF